MTYFTAGCLTFLELLTTKFVERSSLTYNLVRNAGILNPEIMCMAPENGGKLFKGVVDNLIQIDRVTLKEAYSIYAEYNRYLETVIMKNHQLFLNFDKKENRLDKYFFSTVEAWVLIPN